MKKLLLLSLLCASIITYGQQNSGFENWTTDTLAEVPDLWTSSAGEGLGGNVHVAKSSDNHSGNYAIKLQNVVLNGDSNFGFFANGDVGDDLDGGQGFTSNADTIKGWYKCLMQPGDSAIILANFQNPTDTSLIFHVFAGGTVSTWTEFALPVNPQGIVPDTVLFALASTDAINEKGYQDGSWIIVDDLKFYKNGQPVSDDLFNPGFENWSYQTSETPDMWSTYDFFAQTGLPLISKTTNSYSGNYAVQLSTLSAFGDTIPGFLNNGTFNQFNQPVGGHAFSGVLDSIRGQYIYETTSLDTAYMNVIFYNNGTPIGGNVTAFLPNGSSYLPFSFPGFLASTPDTVLINIFSGQNPGSVLTIDDLEFTSGPVSVHKFIFSDFNVYPLPASDILNIKLNHEYEMINANIYDLNGKLIKTTSFNSSLNQIDINDLSGGNYYLKLTEGEKLIGVQTISIVK